MDSSQRLRGRRVQALVVLASQRAPATKPQMKSLWWARRKLLPPSKARSETEETSFLNQARHQMLSDEDVVKAKASVCIWQDALLKESQTCPCGGFKAAGRAMWSSSQSMTSQSRTIHTHTHTLLRIEVALSLSIHLQWASLSDCQGGFVEKCGGSGMLLPSDFSARGVRPAHPIYVTKSIHPR